MSKKRTYTMFFIIVLAVNLIVNLYLFSRTRTFFPASNVGWWISTFFFWLIAFSYLLGRLLERYVPEGLSIPFISIGSWWLGAMVYVTLMFLLIDIFRGLNGLFNFPGLLNFSWFDAKGRIMALVVYILSAIILFAGYYNARVPVVRKVSVQLDKPIPGDSLKFILVSDIHLGITISNKKLQKMVELVNSQEADLVLLAGDVFDEDLGPVIQNNMGDLIKNLEANYGVFAVLGNHEFYGNARKAEDYLEAHNVTVLRDSVVTLPNGIILAGREDITYERMSGKSRKSLKDLLVGVDMNMPVLLMDHQPIHLQEAADN